MEIKLAFKLWFVSRFAYWRRVSQFESMEATSVIIIGAGVAGLAAAGELSAAGVDAIILEARERPGGRIYSVAGMEGRPIELGAEFVHGRKNVTWKLIRAAQLQTHEVPDRHWTAEPGGSIENKKFWEELSTVTDQIDPAQPDMDFESWLASTSAKDSAKWLAREYIEGFHAAPTDRMSIQALAKAEAAAERTEGTRQFHVSQGYSAIVKWLLTQMPRAQLINRSLVKKIEWNPGSVEIETQSAKTSRRFKASHVLVTVPLGVLKEKGPGGIRFEPRLIKTEEAIHALEMGEVVRLTLQFRSRFWPVQNFGFIHSADKWLPTWWSDERGPMLTGWSGGPRARTLAREKPGTILREAIRSLSIIFHIKPRSLRDLLVATYHHNWSNDPFARGAYSFTPAGMGHMPQQLSQPVAGTIFFAGEATDTNGAQGTVHGAIASGVRAAHQILKALPTPRGPRVRRVRSKLRYPQSGFPLARSSRASESLSAGTRTRTPSLT